MEATSTLSPVAFIASLKAVLGLSDFAIPESNMGSTGYIERAHLVPQISTGVDPYNRTFVHLGYFETSTSSASSEFVQRGTGHYLVFQRYSADDFVLTSACESGSCYGGQPTREILDAFVEARLTGREVSVTQGEGKWLYTTVVTPLPGNPDDSRPLLPEGMDAFYDDVLTFLGAGAPEILAHVTGCVEGDRKIAGRIETVRMMPETDHIVSMLLKSIAGGLEVMAAVLPSSRYPELPMRSPEKVALIARANDLIWHIEQTRDRFEA